MATVLAGAMYERVMRWQHQKGGDCMGPDCFRYTFLIAAALSAFGTVLAALLWRRTSKKYQKIIKVRSGQNSPASPHWLQKSMSCWRCCAAVQQKLGQQVMCQGSWARSCWA
jgi:hypothetical protein